MEAREWHLRYVLLRHSDAERLLFMLLFTILVLFVVYSCDGFPIWRTLSGKKAPIVHQLRSSQRNAALATCT